MARILNSTYDRVYNWTQLKRGKSNLTINTKTELAPVVSAEFDLIIDQSRQAAIKEACALSFLNENAGSSLAVCGAKLARIFKLDKPIPKTTLSRVYNKKKIKKKAIITNKYDKSKVPTEAMHHRFRLA